MSEAVLRLQLELALVVPRHLQLEQASEEEPGHLLELVLEQAARQPHRSEPALEEQPRHRSALALVATPHLQARHLLALVWVVSDQLAWVLALEELAVFSEALVEAVMEVSILEVTVVLEQVQVQVLVLALE